MKIPKELIKEYVKSENFTNTTDIMESIKTMFADVLNEVLQCELDEQLGYDKHTRTESDEEKKNYRNGSTKRKLKTQLGEVEISVPRDRNGEYEPKIIDKYQIKYLFFGIIARYLLKCNSFFILIFCRHYHRNRANKIPKNNSVVSLTKAAFDRFKP